MKKLIGMFIIPCSVAIAQDYTIPNLKDTTNRCDYLIVCKNVFLSVARMHADYRKNRSLGEISEPRIALLEDVFTTFPDSITADLKLKEFLRFIYGNWDRKPERVLLVGEPALKDRPETDYSCPTHYFHDIHPTDSFPDDDWLVRFGIPPLDTPVAAIGRIPVRTSQEYSVVLEKTVLFESNMSASKLTALQVYDGDSLWGKCNSSGYDFYSASKFVTQCMPQFIVNSQLQSIIYQADKDGTKRFLEDTIADGINRGVGFLSFCGTGLPNMWSSQRILICDFVIPKLNNTLTPVVMSFTSNINRFHDRSTSMGTKLLIVPDKGVVAAIGAPNEGQYLSALTRLQKTLWSNYPKSIFLGTWLFDSKRINFPYLDPINLLGDPGLVIKVVSITLDIPDTVQLGTRESLNMTGSIPGSYSGSAIIMRYGIPVLINDTTPCSTSVRHYSDLIRTDSTSMQVSGGHFSYTYRPIAPVDSTLPAKVVFYIAADGRRFAAARYFVGGIPSSIKYKSSIHRSADAPYVVIRRGYLLVRNRNPKAGTVYILSLDGRVLAHFGIAGAADEFCLPFARLSRGVYIVRLQSEESIIWQSRFLYQ